MGCRIRQRRQRRRQAIAQGDHVRRREMVAIAIDQVPSDHCRAGICRARPAARIDQGRACATAIAVPSPATPRRASRHVVACRQACRRDGPRGTRGSKSNFGVSAINATAPATGTRRSSAAASPVASTHRRPLAADRHCRPMGWMAGRHDDQVRMFGRDPRQDSIAPVVAFGVGTLEVGVPDGDPCRRTAALGQETSRHDRSFARRRAPGTTGPRGIADEDDGRRRCHVPMRTRRWSLPAATDGSRCRRSPGRRRGRQPATG
jgi:hypothetical protein